MKASVFIAIVCCFWLMNPVWSAARQQDTTQTGVQKQIEAALEETDTEETQQNGEQLIQFLEDLAANPININRVGLHELLKIPGVNLKIARSVINYRKTKPFENLGELMDLKGVGKATYQRMRPYLKVGGGSTRFRDMYLRPGYWTAGNNIDIMMRYQQDVQQKKGYGLPDSAGGYTGGPGKYYQRFRMQSNHYSLNITQEKDPGEPLNTDSGFDFTSGHLALRDNGRLKTLVFGDYSLAFGQGLVLWSGGAFGKGREVIGAPAKNPRGVRAYTSARETDFFRGVAATYGMQLQLTTFYSRRPASASVISGDTTRFPGGSGFHRTWNEQARKNNIIQTTAGGHLQADSPLGLIGITAYYNQFNRYISKGTSVADLYDYEGRDHTVIGLDYQLLLGPVLILGEMARSKNGGMGGIAGVEAPVGKETDVSFSYRYYGKNFQSIFGDGFGEISSAPQNEEGFYVGIRHNVGKGLSLSGYADQYYFPAPRFGSRQSTRGFDVLGLAEVEFSPELEVYVLVRNEQKEDEYITFNSRGNELLQLGKEKRMSIRTHLEYKMNRNVRLRSRIEWVRSREAGEAWESGILLYQDVRLQLSSKLRFDGRLTFFDTESFDTRVYQFESDLLYVLSNVALFNRGQRSYAVIKYKVSDFLECWLKYAVVTYEDAFVVGSGLNEIQGNRRNSVGVQLRFRF